MPDSPTSTQTDRAQLKRAFNEDGYVILPGAVTRGETESVERQLRDEYRKWEESNARFRGGGLLSGHLNCYPGNTARGVVNELRDNGTWDLIQELFPTNPRQVRLGCNFNLPGSVEQHYHIDGLFLDAYLVVNVAVVDTEIKNGAIDVIPKTHKRFYKYWEFATERVNRGSRRLCMSRGDVLVRLSTVWHRGMPNRSELARPMLAITLGEKEVDTADAFDKQGGKVEFQANWFKTDFMGELRERTTIAAPILYSAYRFARSLVGNKGYASF